MGPQEEVKFRTKFINPTAGATIIVGQNPGRQRKDQQTHTVWEGNRSSDLLLEAVDGYENIYFTNVCNYQQMDDGKILEGLNEIQELVEDYEPRVVLCFGEFAYKHVKKLDLGVPVLKLPHPSYIVRFNKNQELYISLVRSYL